MMSEESTIFVLNNNILNDKIIVETLLLAAEEPLTLEQLKQVFILNGKEIKIKELEQIIITLAEDYQATRGMELKEVASGWRIQVKSELAPWIKALQRERPPKYSRALLEVLAIIAYRQPITRSEIEEIRGVAVSTSIIRTLLEHEWIEAVSRRELPGRPLLFTTSKKFLDHFNLCDLSELPELINETNITDLTLMQSTSVDEEEEEA